MSSAGGRRLAAALAVAGLAVTACGGGSLGEQAEGADAAADGERPVVTVGYVTPQTGPLAAFGEADAFVLDQMEAHFAENPLTIGGVEHGVEILVKDSASDAQRAGDAAAELINQDGVDLVLASSTPDTVNPVSDQCEANAVPCITTAAPWQPVYFGRGGTPEQGFDWTYHFFWGLEDVEAVFMDIWDQVDTNQQAAALWPNDPDGNAWGDPQLGFAPVVAERDYSIVDPGFYPNGTQDFSAQIAQFKSSGAEVLLGVPIPPDFTTFWQQAKQQGWTPKVATVGKALLFPSAVEALGDLGNNVSTEVWWSPQHPFSSSLTEQSAAELAAAFEESTGKQWTQPLGIVHSLFEVMAAALESAGSLEPQAVVDAVAGLSVDTVAGTVDWSTGPFPNIAKTPLVGGQWRQTPGVEHPYELVIVTNEQAPEIPTAGEVEPLS
jgi:branched-chain amino acid transport system substrate-binding protein